MAGRIGERSDEQRSGKVNDQFKIALWRGLMHAGLVAAAAFLTTWTDQDISWRTLISATLLPALTVLGTRFVGEGWYDTSRAALRRKRG